VLAGSSQHEIDSQRAAVRKLDADLIEKRRDYERFKILHDDGIISDSDWEAKENAFQSAQALLGEGRSTLEHIAEVRPTDVAVAQASLRSAESAAQTARANLEAADVRAPVSGTVLKIYTRPGERLGDQGLLDLAPNSAVHVVAEVYETDASRLHEGGSALVTSESLPHPLHGTIDQISRVVERQQTVNTDTAANTDARIVRTWILLDRDSAQVASRFNNLQVKVEFQP
jgi:HlyD family secretion protein